MAQQAQTGTREWSEHSCNIQNGCGHQCRYCYARARMLQFKRFDKPKDWGTTYHRIRPAEVKKKRRKLKGVVMFPTTHDIEPEFLDECLAVLRKLLEAGNEVLIVSKPHLECIRTLCEELEPFRHQVMFRFSIGAMSNATLGYWEPGAPSSGERYLALDHAFNKGWNTSVSCEPYLGPPNLAVYLYDSLAPRVTDTIWFGKLNHIRQRCPDASEEEIARIERWQTDDSVLAIYESLKDEPKVRWKDSYQAVLARLGINVRGMGGPKMNVRAT